jgi:hypothetical protein
MQGYFLYSLDNPTNFRLKNAKMTTWPSSLSWISKIAAIFSVYSYGANRRDILGRNWDKNLKTFAPCYSQSPPPAGF